jgi:plastocyanin
MLLLTATLALLAGSAVQAATFNVDVGASGLTYQPTTVTGANGDTIIFTLYVVTIPPRPRPPPD